MSALISCEEVRAAKTADELRCVIERLQEACRRGGVEVHQMVVRMSERACADADVRPARLMAAALYCAAAAAGVAQPGGAAADGFLAAAERCFADPDGDALELRL